MMKVVLCVFLSAFSLVVLGQSDYADGPWRKSLDGEGACWTDPTCKRVMTTAHGGEWNVKYPYDSMPAFQRAWEDGADAIKGDFRVAKDNIGMVMHSSPVEVYESPNCWGKYVEEMTSDECAQCKMEITSYTFVKVPDLLSWAQDKVNVMFCVKKSTDIPRAITSLLEYNASHRAFLEVHIEDFLVLEQNKVPHWDEVYYVVEMHSHDDLMSFFAASPSLQKRGFLLEFNAYDSWVNITDDIKDAQSKGFRTFAASNDNPVTATVQNHLDLYADGIDVAYTYNLTNAVIARKQVNGERGISPP